MRTWQHVQSGNSQFWWNGLLESVKRDGWCSKFIQVSISIFCFKFFFLCCFSINPENWMTFCDCESGKIDNFTVQQKNQHILMFWICIYYENGFKKNNNQLMVLSWCTLIRHHSLHFHVLSQLVVKLNNDRSRKNKL